MISFEGPAAAKSSPSGCHATPALATLFPRICKNIRSSDMELCLKATQGVVSVSSHEDGKAITASSLKTHYDECLYAAKLGLHHIISKTIDPQWESQKCLGR